METEMALLWALFWAIAILVPVAILVATLWFLDKLMPFMEPVKMALVRITPLGVSLGLATWAVTDPCMPPALRGFFLFMLVIAIPASAWFALGIRNHGEEWERAARISKERTSNFVERWRPGSRTP